MPDVLEPKHKNEQDRSLLRWTNETFEKMYIAHYGTSALATPTDVRFAQKLLLVGVKWGRENGSSPKPSINTNIYEVLRGIFDTYVPKLADRGFPDNWKMSNEVNIPEETWLDIKLDLSSHFSFDLLDAPLETMTIRETVRYLEAILKVHE